MIGIYMIRCKQNNKVYIGQSKKMKTRISQHKTDLSGGYSCHKDMQADYNAFGPNQFEFVILQLVENSDNLQDRLDELEQYYIKMYNSNDKNCGYNIEGGGKLRKGHLAKETREKLSKANRGKFIGRKASDETKRLMSQNSAKYWLGKKLPDYVKEKLRKARKGKPCPWLHKKQSPELIAKRTQCQFGKIWVHNDFESRFISPELKDEFLSNGYVLGRPFAKRNRKRKEK